MTGRRKHRGSFLRRCRGYTLVELLVTLVIAGILFGVALPSYNRHAMKAARADARISLLETAAWQEMYYTRHLRYSPDADPVSDPAREQVLTANGHYLVSVAACEEEGISSCYIARAEPLDRQQADECGTFYLDSTGRRSVSNENTDNCW